MLVASTKATLVSAALYPLLEDGLRSRTVRAAAVVELFNEDGEPRRRSAGSATTPCLRWKVNCGWSAKLARQSQSLGKGISLGDMSSANRT